MKSYVAVHPEDGVFLGMAFGLAFFSKLDPVGQRCCPAGITVEEIRDDLQHEMPDVVGKLEFVEVETAHAYSATLEECVAAGLEEWEPEGVPEG